MFLIVHNLLFQPGYPLLELLLLVLPPLDCLHALLLLLLGYALQIDPSRLEPILQLLVPLLQLQDGQAQGRVAGRLGLLGLVQFLV